MFECFPFSWKGISVTKLYLHKLSYLNLENTMRSQLFLSFCLELHSVMCPLALSSTLKVSIPFPKS